MQKENWSWFRLRDFSRVCYWFLVCALYKLGGYSLSRAHVFPHVISCSSTVSSERFFLPGYMFSARRSQWLHVSRVQKSVVTCFPVLRSQWFHVFLRSEVSGQRLHVPALVASFLLGYLPEENQQSALTSVATSSYLGLIPMLFRSEILKISANSESNFHWRITFVGSTWFLLRNTRD